jgi:hypothetical protein
MTKSASSTAYSVNCRCRLISQGSSIFENGSAKLCLGSGGILEIVCCRLDAEIRRRPEKLGASHGVSQNFIIYTSNIIF